MIVNGLAIGGPILLALAAGGVAVLLLRRDEGRHTADPLFRARAPEVHHTEYTPYDWAPAPEDMGPGAGSFPAGQAAGVSTGYHSHLPMRSNEPPKVDSPAPEDVREVPVAGDPGPGQGRSQVPAAGLPARLLPALPAAAGGAAIDAPPPPPVTWTDHLDAGWAIAAELGKPSDEERWPDLARPWEDDTGTFERETLLAAVEAYGRGA